jgi:AcrR family transcriptional regulator
MASSTPDPLTPRARQIVAAAREILEDEGRDALTMRRIAEHLGIRAPSLYKHFPDKQALEAAIISAAFEEQAELFENAIEGSADPLAALAAVYRKFAHAHPDLYRVMTDQELRRDLIAPGVEARAGLPIYLAAGQDADRARAAWAFAHGMAMLELTNRFPPGADLDAAWAAGVGAFRDRTRGGPESHRRP